MTMEEDAKISTFLKSTQFHHNATILDQKHNHKSSRHHKK